MCALGVGRRLLVVGQRYEGGRNQETGSRETAIPFVSSFRPPAFSVALWRVLADGQRPTTNDPPEGA